MDETQVSKVRGREEGGGAEDRTGYLGPLCEEQQTVLLQLSCLDRKAQEMLHQFTLG